MNNNLNRRQFLKTAGFGAASLALQGCIGNLQQKPSKHPDRPNVLFIFYDQLRADACSVYGGRNIETPCIDSLASKGVRLVNAISTCPLCTPYRGMLQTGRYPTHSGLVLNWVNANPNQRCIAHIFRDAGYRTGFIGKWHLSAGRFKHSGKFEHTADKPIWSSAWLKDKPHTEFTPPGPDRLGYEHWEAFNFHTDFNNPYYYRDKPEKLYMPGYETDGETDLAIRFMQKHKDSPQPFFLMVAPHPPHPPFSPSHCPAGYLDRISEQLRWSPNVPKAHKRRKRQLQARCYYAMCKNADDNIGRITKFLDESGLSENTIVVFTSDHGEQHGSHNRTDKMVPYAESVNIPLIFRWPGRIPAGTANDTLYTPIDHMATLCGLAGLKPPETCDGMDLSLSLLDKRKVNRDDVLMANYVSNWDYFQSGTKWPEWRAVRSRQFTYVRWLTGSEELYDNLADPYQMNNLAEGQKDLPRLKKMRKRLNDLLAEAHDDFRPGTGYAEWYDDKRNLIRTSLGPV